MHLTGRRLSPGGRFSAAANTRLVQDRTIVATAVPKITSEFNSLDDAAWYRSSYLFATCAFQLLFGKLYTRVSIKWAFVASLLIFEVGSVICGAAPNSVALILGRAIAGIGCAGVTAGALIVRSPTTGPRGRIADLCRSWRNVSPWKTGPSTPVG